MNKEKREQLIIELKSKQPSKKENKTRYFDFEHVLNLLANFSSYQSGPLYESESDIDPEEDILGMADNLL